MLSYISWNIDPVLFDFKLFGTSFPLRWYGILFAGGFLVAQQILYYIYQQEGKSRQAVDVLTVYFVVAAIIGARLGHYLFYEWPLLVQQPLQWAIELITPPFAGLASHGATILILIGVYLYARRYETPFLWVLDRLVIVAPIGGAMIRLGNLLNSEIYGKATTVPWAFIFERETDPRLLPLVPRHPTQIYEALFCLLLFGLMFYLWKTRRVVLAEGMLSGLFLILLFAFRFVVEFVKNDQVSFESDYVLNMGQLLSLPGIAMGIAIIVYACKLPGREARAGQ